MRTTIFFSFVNNEVTTKNEIIDCFIANCPRQNDAILNFLKLCFEKTYKNPVFKDKDFFYLYYLPAQISIMEDLLQQDFYADLHSRYKHNFEVFLEHYVNFLANELENKYKEQTAQQELPEDFADVLKQTQTEMLYLNKLTEMHDILWHMDRKGILDKNLQNTESCFLTDSIFNNIFTNLYTDIVSWSIMPTVEQFKRIPESSLSYFNTTTNSDFNTIVLPLLLTSSLDDQVIKDFLHKFTFDEQFRNTFNSFAKFMSKDLLNFNTYLLPSLLKQNNTSQVRQNVMNFLNTVDNRILTDINSYITNQDQTDLFALLTANNKITFHNPTGMFSWLSKSADHLRFLSAINQLDEVTCRNVLASLSNEKIIEEINNLEQFNKIINDTIDFYNNQQNKPANDDEDFDMKMSGI